jgi:tripartite-type tricarboxylate transporter receptor subunit TctC
MVAAFLAPGVASAQQFYAGKTVRVVVGYTPGSTFDTYSRALIRHMPRLVPGQPSMIIQNMPGAGSLTATNYLANVAPADGTMIGMPNPVNTVDPLLNPQQSRFDPRKFAWIGSMNSETSTCAFFGGRIKTLDDVRTKKVVVGSTGPSAGSTLDARMVKGVFGFNFDIVTGYPGLPEIRLAAQTGEVDGHCGLLVSSLKVDLWDRYKKGLVSVPFQMGLEKHPELPDVPNVFEFAKSEEDRLALTLVFGPWRYGRPLMAPGATPKDRLEILRTAFMQTMKDEQFLTEAKKMNLEIQPIDAATVEKLVKQIFETPQPIVERTRKLLGIVK